MGRGGRSGVLGISSCLLGQNVRYDGGHKHDSFLIQTLGPFVEWVAVCPEVDVGMGISRESVRLVGSPEQPRMLAERSGRDWIERIFAYQRWRTLTAGRLSRGALVEFHTQHKLVLLAHSEPHLRRLGRLVAAAKTRPLRAVIEEYGRLFMEALAALATVRKHVNVLQHIVGYFTDRLTAEERDELREVITDYHRKLVPLVVPLTLIRHYVKKYQVSYIPEQVYLQPHPKELMLRNHV